VPQEETYSGCGSGTQIRFSECLDSAHAQQRDHFAARTLLISLVSAALVKRLQLPVCEA
jgi:hypothetical protein